MMMDHAIDNVRESFPYLPNKKESPQIGLEQPLLNKSFAFNLNPA